MVPRPGFLLPRPPDVLGILVRQAEILEEAVAHLARWAGGEDGGTAEHVVALRATADDVATELVDTVFDALITPIDREDAMTLSERLRVAFRSARGLVSEGQVLEVHPDAHLADMGAVLAGQAEGVLAAVRALPSDADAARAAVDAVETGDRALDALYRVAMSDTVHRDEELGVVFGSRELYRRAAQTSLALLHAAHFARYVVLKES